MVLSHWLLHVSKHEGVVYVLHDVSFPLTYSKPLTQKAGNTVFFSVGLEGILLLAYQRAFLVHTLHIWPPLPYVNHTVHSLVSSDQ